MGAEAGRRPEVNKFEHVLKLLHGNPNSPPPKTDTTENITFPYYVAGGKQLRMRFLSFCIAIVCIYFSFLACSWANRNFGQLLSNQNNDPNGAEYCTILIRTF